MMRGPVWGVRRRLVSVIPSRSAGKDCPAPGGIVSQPSPYPFRPSGRRKGYSTSSINPGPCLFKPFF